MANKDEIATAIKVITEVAGDPSIGPVKELIDLLKANPTEAKDFTTPDKEIRVASAKETR